MKLFFKIIAIPITLLLIGCQERAVKEEHFKNGQIKKSWALKKNSSGKYIKDGIMKTWFPDGNMQSEFTYENGQMEGKAQTWYLNGQIQFDGNYLQGYLVLESQWDEEGGQIISREYTIKSVYYENPSNDGSKTLREKFTVLKRDNNSLIKHGTFRSWHENGKLSKISEYSEGQKDGFAKEWFVNGRLMSQGHYQKGQKEGPWSYAYESGKIKYKILYYNNLKDGPFTWWHPNGKKKQLAEYTSDSLDGEFKSWFETGKLKEKKNFTSGIQTGNATYYYQNKQMQRRENWKAGRIQDSVIEWFENGTLKSNKQYLSGVLNNQSKIWYPNGNLFIQSNYKNGKLQGDYQWWTEKGEIISKQKYSKGVLVFDSRVARMRKILEAGEVKIPIRFMGFQWGMNAEEVEANIRKLNGSLTQRLPEDLTFSLPAKNGGRDAQITGKVQFNNWGELWSIKMDFPNDNQLKFSKFANFVEHELRFKLGLPRYTRDFKDLPGMLEKERKWGTLFVETAQPPIVKNQYPTIRAHLFAYENQKWVTLELQNYLIREYASDREIKLSGPFYDAISS